MLSWLFKKRGTPVAPTAAPSAQAQAALKVAIKAETKAQLSVDAKAQWLPRLQAAQGDDAALLRVALEAPVLDIKLAAVEALTHEDALKQAERALRPSDSRVHRAAKQRWQAAVAQREARTQAQALIATATALSTDALLPANRLVTLDRDWQALDSALLPAEQIAQFTALRDALNTALRAQGEAEQERLRTAQAQVAAQAAAQAQAEQAQAEQAMAAAAQEAATQQLATPEPTPGEADAAESAHLPASSEATPHTAADAAPQRPARAKRPAPSAEQWQRLDDLLLQLEAAFADGQLSGMQAQWDGLAAALDALHGAPMNDARRARWQALHAERARLNDWQQWGGSLALDALVAEAEALAQLTLAAAGTPGLRGGAVASTAVVSAPLTAHTAEPATEAPTTEPSLNAALLPPLGEGGDGGPQEAISPPQAPTPTPPQQGREPGGEVLATEVLATASSPHTHTPKLHLKAHGEAIHGLRARWKEIARQGNATSRALWPRFDGALQIAYVPVAAHQEVLKAARLENLAARHALLATLDALPDPAADIAADALTAHWKARAHALGEFQLAWRQLGPLEHTAPASARGDLQQRLRSSLERVEAPLQAARREAEQQREQLIARAEALVQELARQPQLRDTTARVRELQAQWQQHARTLTLARAVESALWARFKAATDAVFAQREAAHSAREAELATSVAEREALLQRLQSLGISLTGDSTPSADVQRGMSEIERAWRHAPELPRTAVGAELEKRFRDIHSAVLSALNARTQHAWQAQCDALSATLRGEPAAVAVNVAASVAATETPTPALPAAWAHALAERADISAGTANAAPLSTAALDDLLLQLEIALDVPASAEWQARRRELKLRAMKDALEGRSAGVSVGPAQHSASFAAVLRQHPLSAAQQERLLALVATLRQAEPGTLATPAHTKGGGR